MRPVVLALAALALAAATPPGWFVGAGLLIVPALAAFYALVTTSSRPYLAAYLVGLVHVALFSWSLHHVLWFGYLAIVVLGAAYYTLVVLWTRALGSWLSAPLAFGLGVAVSLALRAAMPELEYPHGQPVHCLYRFPWLLGPVAWGGEILANTLIAAFAAAAVDLYRSWHGARPAWRGARIRVIVFTVVPSLLCLVPPPAPMANGAPGVVDVVALQPNLTPAFQHDAAGRAEFERALVQPTLAVAGEAVASPPDLVLWPETAYPLMLDASGDQPRLAGPNWFVPLAERTRLLAGTLGQFGSGRRTPACVLLDARGRLLEHYQKQRLVAAGEYIPLISVLPDSWRDGLMNLVEQQMGAGAPDFLPGDRRPLLKTAADIAFGALLCYDSAFPEVARDHVARGARFLVVLSNESWYRGGAELDQLEAITVCRALETGTPVVRCTMDGATLVLDAGGHVMARIPRGADQSPDVGVLRAEITLGPGSLPPLSWLHSLAGWLLLISAAAVAWRVLGIPATLVPGRPDRAENRVRE